MADIFLEMKDRVAAGKKAILWAANGHILKHSLGAKKQSSMGYFLSQTLKENYASYLLIASQYETHSIWQGYGQEKAPQGSLEEWLETFNRPSLFVDFKKLTAKLLDSSEEEFDLYNPLQTAEGAFYLKKSEPMELVTDSS